MCEYVGSMSVLTYINSTLFMKGLYNVDIKHCIFNISLLSDVEVM